MKPDIFYSQIPAQIPAGSVDEKVLFIGTKNGGTATSATLTQDIKFLQEETLFGAKSLISESIRGFRINNQSTMLDAYAMNEAGGSVKAVGSLKIDDTASINNVLTVQINGYKYTEGDRIELWSTIPENIRITGKLVEKNKKERQERAFKRITEFILLVEEEENVSVFIQPINIQPQLTIIAK